MHFETRAIWVGQEPDEATGATIVPIYQTSTFSQEEIGKNKGYEYTRSGNPTRAALEQCLASLEEGRHGLSFSSGLAAEHAVLSMLRPGDHVIAPEDMYGGTYRLFTKVWEPMQVRFSYLDFTNLASIEAAFTAQTRMVWIESPTNPTLKIFDIAALSAMAHRHNVLVVVDNTFATPYFQKPLLLGADIVVHSTTKYINGHSDVIGGAVIVSEPSLYESIKFYQNSLGGVPSPFDAWLTLRGLKTLVVRMQQHEKNAFAVARYLGKHPNIDKVLYPGLETHVNHAVAKKQMSGFGGLVSVQIKGGFNEVNAFMKKLKVFSLAESLGGVESLANYSTRMTHASYPEELKQKIGITENLVRLSIGLEHADDLIADLGNALG